MDECVDGGLHQYASADREHAARLAGKAHPGGYDGGDRAITPGRVFEVIQEAIQVAARNRLVPVLIEDALPSIGFKRIQAADLTARGSEGHADDLRYQQMEQAVARYVRGEVGPGAAPLPHRQQSPRANATRLKVFGGGV